MTTSRYHRVVLKLSGEAFADQKIGFGIDAVVVQRIAEEVTKARADLGVEIAIVVGGGNIFRGLTGAARSSGRTLGVSFAPRIRTPSTGVTVARSDSLRSLTSSSQGARPG